MKSRHSFLFPFLFLLMITSFCLSAAEDHLAALIEKGELLIRQGSYPAGIALLEAVVNKDPKNSRALNSLLTACDTYSQKLIAENHFDQAQTYLKKMEKMIPQIGSLPAREFASEDINTSSRIKREMISTKAFLLSSEQGEKAEVVSLNAGRERYNEAVRKFNQRQYEMADNLLKESIELDPTNPYAYELLGEIANLNHRLEEAEAYYKKAFSLNPDLKVKAKYEKLVREKNIDKTQQQYLDEHFVIRYRRSESLEGSKIRDYLREAYRTISQDFGHYPKYKIPVVLYDRTEYEVLMGGTPHWSSALYDGKIRLPVYGQALEGDLRKLIYHELTHAFVLDLSQTKCPIWLNEGLAQYQENKAKPIPLEPLIDAVRTKTLFSIDELMFEDISKDQSHEKALLFYIQSFSLVSYLLGHSRLYDMKQLLIELGKSTPFLKAFEKVYGRPFEDFTGRWREDLEAHYGA